MSRKNSSVVEMLTKAYQMEIETVCNYVANSVMLDGIDAMEVKRSLGEDVKEELDHARRLAARIKQLSGKVPGSKGLAFDQITLQPPEDTCDIASVIAGVVAAEQAAVDHYSALIQVAQDNDPVTADLATQILAEEYDHLTLFTGFQKAIESRHQYA